MPVSLGLAFHRQQRLLPLLPPPPPPPPPPLLNTTETLIPDDKSPLPDNQVFPPCSYLEGLPCPLPLNQPWSPSCRGFLQHPPAPNPLPWSILELLPPRRRSIPDQPVVRAASYAPPPSSGEQLTLTSAGDPA